MFQVLLLVLLPFSPSPPRVMNLRMEINHWKRLKALNSVVENLTVRSASEWRDY